MPSVIDPLLDQHVSLQWRGVVGALATEFEGQLGPGELRQLMARVGARFAAAHPLRPCASTDDLAHALNALWRDMQWGYVELADERDHLRITHFGAPWRAFGSRALAWAPAFLEGSYQTWLSGLGASDLSVVQAGESGDGFAIEYRLGRGAG
jgi:sugar phosphate isomerase/epimerase